MVRSDSCREEGTPSASPDPRGTNHEVFIGREQHKCKQHSRSPLLQLFQYECGACSPASHGEGSGVVCFVLCLATFLFELVYICRKKKSSTLQRFFVYLTFSSLLYSAALSFHLERYFLYDQQIQCYVCEVVGFFDQYQFSSC